MGSSLAQVGQSTQPQGKGFASPQSHPVDITAAQPQETRQGKGGSVTLPGQGGQPKMGQPNPYPNTVGQWDNASIQPQQSRNRGGKGKV